MTHRYVRPSPPPSVPDWYAKGIAVLQVFLDRAQGMTVPVVYDDMNEAVFLCRRLVALVDDSVVRDVKAPPRNPVGP